MPEIFPIYTYEDACQAARRMEELCARNDESSVQEYRVWEQLLAYWESKQDTKIQADPVEVVKELLVGKDVSQRDLAAQVGTSESTLSSILAGSRPLSVRMARRISEALGLSPDALKVG